MPAVGHLRRAEERETHQAQDAKLTPCEIISRRTYNSGQ